MEEQKPKAKAKPVNKFYSKNFYVANIGPILGMAVSNEIDKALDAVLQGSKAADYHVSKEVLEKNQEISALKIGIKKVAPKK